MLSMSNNQQSSANKNCLSKHTYTYKIDADNHLHNCVCGALSIAITVLETYLQNYYREEQLSTASLMILYHDAEVNYRKLLYNFLRSKFHQLFTPIELIF